MARAILYWTLEQEQQIGISEKDELKRCLSIEIVLAAQAAAQIISDVNPGNFVLECRSSEPKVERPPVLKVYASGISLSGHIYWDIENEAIMLRQRLFGSILHRYFPDFTLELNLTVSSAQHGPIRLKQAA